ncbi:hypothetical protein [Chitinophaga sp. Cy-1792]|uniref:hypothetical protein n=1 Tax=Chitinophaga sp. Cy-1792 TaxID=2608339 RepID=UPI0014242FDD|nr:hypothetical protein [Chitinophaga sp. Cy-1792]NIG53700.1 hypothetical protein [Chitinophaga sp. Cy-1792]
MEKKLIEVVVNENGFVDWRATELEEQRKLREFLECRDAQIELDPSIGLRDLIRAGIMDENANFTEPYKSLNQFKRK